MLHLWLFYVLLYLLLQTKIARDNRVIKNKSKTEFFLCRVKLTTEAYSMNFSPKASIVVLTGLWDVVCKCTYK